MSSFLKVVWHHSYPDEPVWLYSELDDERYEVRKVEVYRDGRRVFADQVRSVGGSMLGEIPAPTILEFSDEFEDLEASEISEAEFESQWSATISGYGEIRE
ncbi:hypothetical protein ACEZDB_00550 [Streptacidiphilus sp. N1-3]|uniref:DUF6881 domain-containing protein n=1 Tax=Streptacidiphilus alkalitolerans TaxID=3342712 RepID=A0ABV6WSY6_9ACTN